MCRLYPLLLLSVYDTGSLSYYKLHGAGVGVLNVLTIHSYVTVRMCIIVRIVHDCIDKFIPFI